MPIYPSEPNVESTTIVDSGGINIASVSATGAQKVDGSAVTQPISAATLPLPTGAATSALQTSGNSILSTIATNTGTASTDTIVNSTITAVNGTVAVNAQGDYTVSASITGTWSATLIAEGQLADTTWVQIPMYLVNTTLPYNSVFSTTSNGTFLITGGGYFQIRIRATAYTSGTVAVGLDASLAQQTIFSSQLGTWTVQPGNTVNTTAWLAKSPDANLWVTGTAATGVALTVTLPAVASQFHHIKLLEIEAYTTAARTGSATPVLVTSTNLPGSPVWTFATAAAIGTTDSKVYTFDSALNSSVAGTATTIVCPATTGVIWRVNVSYFASV